MRSKGRKVQRCPSLSQHEKTSDCSVIPFFTLEGDARCTEIMNIHFKAD
nr:MAG TPA: hypothetical protein [Bacteriophage sp.]